LELVDLVRLEVGELKAHLINKHEPCHKLKLARLALANLASLKLVGEHNRRAASLSLLVGEHLWPIIGCRCAWQLAKKKRKTKKRKIKNKIKVI